MQLLGFDVAVVEGVEPTVNGASLLQELLEAAVLLPESLGVGYLELDLVFVDLGGLLLGEDGGELLVGVVDAGLDCPFGRGTVIELLSFGLDHELGILLGLLLLETVLEE